MLLLLLLSLLPSAASVEGGIGLYPGHLSASKLALRRNSDSSSLKSESSVIFRYCGVDGVVVVVDVSVAVAAAPPSVAAVGGPPPPNSMSRALTSASPLNAAAVAMVVRVDCS